MRRNAIARIIIYSLLIFVLVGILISGLDHDGFNWGTGSSGNYMTGSGSVDMSQIENIQIEWVSGNVDVILVPDTETTISFSETNGEDHPMVYEIKGKTLVIRFTKQTIHLNFGNFNTPDKDLKIQIPENWSCRSLDIEAVSANVSVHLSEANDVEIENVSGKTDLNITKSGSVSVETVSGEVLFNGNCNEFDGSSVSGDCEVKLFGDAKDIALESVSGDLTVSILKDYGFTATIDSASGHIYSDYSTTVSGGKHTYGDGKIRIEAETVSGDIFIRENRIELTDS